MKHLTIIVPDCQTTLSSVACIVGAHEIFAAANEYWNENGKDDLFKIELAGVSEQSEFHNGMLSLKSLSPVSTISKTNLILIPSLVLDFQKAMDGNKLLADWVAKQYRNGAEVASMCTGAYMLASAGLLDGKKCSTHWRTANNFRTVFPNVILK